MSPLVVIIIVGNIATLLLAPIQPSILSRDTQSRHCSLERRQHHKQLQMNPLIFTNTNKFVETRQNIDNINNNPFRKQIILSLRHSIDCVNLIGNDHDNSLGDPPRTARFSASRNFRRRSYDDQEGDNDINIILQPSDLDDIEKQTRARCHAAAEAAVATTFEGEGQHIIKPTNGPGNDDIDDGKEETSSNETWKKSENTTLVTATTTTTTLKINNTSAMKTPQSRIRAMGDLFKDMKLAECLLDQDYNRTVRLFIKKSALNWNFNSFTFDAMCCGRSLTELLLHLFDYYKLMQIFNLDIVKVLKCFRLLEFGYHSTNPYHNSVHAADVTQAMHCFIQENKIRKHMTNLEILSSILAAVCHDLDHPGVNQSFLVATRNPLVDLYKNNSVLENHHWRFALCIFREAQVFDHFTEAQNEDMKDQMKHLILATDIARQNDYLKRFKILTSSQEFSMNDTANRALVLQMALKCADLGNPCRPWLISRVWSNLICDEFYRMGQIERQLGVPLTPICQREKTSIAGIQTDFFRFIVLPLLELWHNFLQSPLSDLLMANFNHNYQRWQRANRIVQQLRRRKSVACLEPVEDSDNDDEVGKNNRASPLPIYRGNTFHGCPSTSMIAAAATSSTSAAQLFDPTMEALCSKHSFAAIKRASSDYIKSGNGRLELLRNFQLDRIIEKSPLMSRRPNKLCSAAASSTATAKQTAVSAERPIKTGCCARQIGAGQPEAGACKGGGGCSGTDDGSGCSDKPEQISPKQPKQSTTATTCPPGRGQCSTVRSGSEPTACPSSKSCCTEAVKTASKMATPPQHHPSPQQPVSGCATSGYRKALSPIQDGEGTSPETTGEHCHGADQKDHLKCSYSGARHQAAPIVTRTTAANTAVAVSGPFASSPASPAESGQSSSSASLSASRASSASSSPLMRRSVSTRSSTERNLHHQHNQRPGGGQHPLLAQYYGPPHPPCGTESKPSNLTSARQSFTISKNLYSNSTISNKRRESDPGCLTDDYGLAAAIVLLQYQNTSLFHKRRSSLPVCVPRRRSSK